MITINTAYLRPPAPHRPWSSAILVGLLVLLMLMPIRGLPQTSTATTPETLTLGLFAYRPKPVMESQWRPLVDYFNQHLPTGLSVELRLLTQTEMQAALDRGELDLVFTNPVHYVELRARNELSGALATLTRLQNNLPVSHLGGVIIRRSGDQGPDRLEDLAGHRIAVVGKQYLGGYAAPLFELSQAGIDPSTLDLAFTGGSHDDVIAAVLSGAAEVGFIRTSVLEKMVTEGTLSPDALTVVAPRHHGDFPFAVSTALYPEWAFVAHRSLSEQRSKQVAALLYELSPDSPAAQAAGINGFTIPDDYEVIETLMSQLRLPPFDHAPDFGWRDIWQRYHIALMAGVALLVIILALVLVLATGYQRRRRLEKRANLLASRLETIIEGTGTGTWQWNVQTGETSVNRHWAGMLGYHPHELPPITQETWRNLVHPGDLDTINQAIANHLSGLKPLYTAEYRMQHRNGDWVWISDRGQLRTHTNDGDPEWMFGTHIDVTARHRLIETQQQWIQRFEQFSTNVPGVLYQYRRRPDGTSHFPFASPGLSDIYGCTPADVAEDASPVFGVIHPEDMPLIQKTIGESASTLTTWQCTYRVRHPVKGERWVQGSATPSRQEDGSIIWHGYIRDVTAEKRGQTQLRLAASVFEASQEGIFITTPEHRLVDANPAFETITGYRAETLKHQPVSVLFGQEQQNTMLPAAIQSLTERRSWNGEALLQTRDGHEIPVEFSVSAVCDDAGHVAHYVAVFNDTSERKRHQEELERIAYFDPLTGIPNRRMLQERLHQAIAQASRRRETLAVCMLDLDGFKPVNDTYGHKSGDQVLVEVARRLGSLLRAEDTVARLGGDEFVLLMVGNVVESVFQRVLQSLRVPIDLGNAEVRISGSLGVAFLDNEAPCDGDQLLRRADQAVYMAKQAGRDQFCVYDLDIIES